MLSASLPRATLVLTWEESSHLEARVPAASCQPLPHSSLEKLSVLLWNTSDQRWSLEVDPSATPTEVWRSSLQGGYMHKNFTLPPFTRLCRAQPMARSSGCTYWHSTPPDFLSCTGPVCWGHTSPILCLQGGWYAQQANLVFKPDP